MNERQYALCATLTDAERKQDRGAPFGSIHGTLNHLLLADQIWMGRFGGDAHRFLSGPVHSLDEEVHGEFQALHRDRVAMDERIEQWAEGLTAEGLAAPITFTGIVRPEERTMPLWFAVQHFFNHQTHHRGQLTVLLEQAGCDCGVTDLLWLPQPSTP